jgi:ureidoglycolate lyase
MRRVVLRSSISWHTRLYSILAAFKRREQNHTHILRKKIKRMLPQITAPNLNLLVEPLTQDGFASFGTVIENPATASARSTHTPQVVQANQNTALKYINVSHMPNYYNLAPSNKPARAIMNMFVCWPRKLASFSSTTTTGREDETYKFAVRILERHAFTPQTFVPLGLAAAEASSVYLVIVAPTRADESSHDSPYPLHVPRFASSLDAHVLPKGPGWPDLGRARAFVANGSQAVTYAAGTWHAPMVVLGAKAIDFLVVQYANDVALEDCQEIEITSEADSDGLNVLVDATRLGVKLDERAKL